MRKKLFCILLVTCGTILSLGMTPQMEVLTERLKEIVTENLQLKQKITELNNQIVDYKTQIRNDKIALEPARFASEKGNSTSQWLRNPDHLRRVWKWVQQYKYILTKDSLESAKTFNIEYFAYAWFFKESHFDPYAKNTNDNKTKDWGMAQINDVCWDILYVKLPDELKKRPNPKEDPEIAVCMLYLWINDRIANKWSYCYLSDEAWVLVWRLGKING